MAYQLSEEEQLILATVKKFLDKFVAQESEIEALQKTLRQTQAVLTSTQREFDVFLAALNVE